MTSMDYIKEYFPFQFFHQSLFVKSDYHNNLFPSDLEWFMLCFTCIFASYYVFKELLLTLITNKFIPKLNQLRLVNAIWRVIFSGLCCALCGPLLVKDITFGNSNIFSMVAKVFSTSIGAHDSINIYNNNFETYSHVLQYYIAPVTFFIHQIYLSLHSCIPSSIFSLLSFSVFLHAAFSLRRLDLSVKMLFLIAVNEGSMELARACVALKSRCKGSKGIPEPFPLRVLVIPLFALHILIRLFVSLYLYPTFFLSLPSLIETEKKAQLITAYINIFLTLYFPWLIFNSPICSALEIVLRPKNKKPLSFWAVPGLVLLPYSSSLLHELREKQLNTLKNLPLTSAEIRMMRRNLLSQSKETAEPQHSQVTDHAGGLLSVVKCMIALKKKMRHRYERKLSSELDETDQVYSFNEPNETQNGHSFNSNLEGNQTSKEDVTDIFIPVPNISLPTSSPSELDVEEASASAENSISHRLEEIKMNKHQIDYLAQNRDCNQCTDENNEDELDELTVENESKRENLEEK